jgi:hypothetical protein
MSICMSVVLLTVTTKDKTDWEAGSDSGLVTIPNELVCFSFCCSYRLKAFL